MSVSNLKPPNKSLDSDLVKLSTAPFMLSIDVPIDFVPLLQSWQNQWMFGQLRTALSMVLIIDTHLEWNFSAHIPSHLIKSAFVICSLQVKHFVDILIRDSRYADKMMNDESDH